jgi:hypothetical protein
MSTKPLMHEDEDEILVAEIVDDPTDSAAQLHEVEMQARARLKLEGQGRDQAQTGALGMRRAPVDPETGDHGVVGSGKQWSQRRSSVHVGADGPMRGRREKPAEPILVCGACLFGGFLSGLHYMLLYFYGHQAMVLAGDLVWVDTHSLAIRASTVRACVAHSLLYPIANLVFWGIYFVFIRDQANVCADGREMTVRCLFNEQGTLYVVLYCVEFALACCIAFHWLLDGLVVYRYAQSLNRLADFSMKWIFPSVAWCSLVAALVVVLLGPDPLV